MSGAGTSAGLREHLVASRIAGAVDTSRQDNLRNAARMAEGLDKYAFGLEPLGRWTADEVVQVMVERCGIVADLTHIEGEDRIDPDLTLAQLARWRSRLAKAAAGQERVLIATGHPTGVLAIHLRIASALRAAGCEVVVPALDWRWPWPTNPGDPASGDGGWGRSRPRHVRTLNGVHVLASGGELLHTHDAEPMRAVLAALGDDPPSLVVADHGWAGAAVQAGLDTLGLADCNDPALFVAEHEGRSIITVPLDDNVSPHLYDPVSDHLLDW